LTVQKGQINIKNDIEQSHFLHYNLKSIAPTVARGEGIYLYDTSGKKYIDGTSGSVVCNIGLGQPLAEIVFEHIQLITNASTET